MKIYVAHSSNFDFKTELYSPLRESPLNTQYEIILPHETDAFINTKEIIKKSDIVIAEVSFPATGEGIELGWASDENVKIICIYKEGRKISNSLKTVSDKFIAYSDLTDMINKLSDALQAEIENKDLSSETDPLLDEVYDYLTKFDFPLAWVLQKKFKIGFSRAERILKQLEAKK